MWNARLHRIAPFVVALPLALCVVPATIRAQVVVPRRTPVVTAPKTVPVTKAPAPVAPAPAASAPALASLSQSFVLGVGERTGFGLVVGKPGPITVNVRWTGVPLIVSLVKPGGGSVDQQGAGSVTLQYTATADDVKKGMLWSANVRPAQASTAPSSTVDMPIKLMVANVATGTVNVQYPVGDVKLAQAELNAKASQALSVKPTPQQLSTARSSALAAKQAALQTTQTNRQTTILAALKPKVSVQAFQNVSSRVAVQAKSVAGIVPTKAATKTTGTSQQADVSSAGSNAPATVAASPTIGSLSATSGQPGDPIFISGSAFSNDPGEVHFIVANGKDLVAPVSAWNDTQIFAAVPDVSGIQAFSGQMYVKRGTTASKLVPFQFNPSLEIRTLGITNDRSTNSGSVDMNYGTVVQPGSYDFLFGHRGDDQFFMSTSLKNGWTVKSTYLRGYSGGGSGLGGVLVVGSGNAYVTESRQGTDSPYVKVHWWVDWGSAVNYIVQVDIIGPKGVPNF